jgi:hypothetical protein
MDTWSRVNLSSDNFGDSSSFVGSVASPIGPVDNGSSGEVCSRALQDIRAKLSRLKLVLASRENTLVERLNQLSRMIGELDSKDHQLALMNRPMQLRDRWITELEAQLVDVHKGRMQEANGVHASIRLLVDTEIECWQFRRRCRL